MICYGWRIVIVDRNDAQVGNLAMQYEEGVRLVQAQPLFAVTAVTLETPGGLISLADA
jgi:carbamate kinase